MRVPLTSAKLAGAGNPDFIKFIDDGSASVGVYGYAFDKASDEYMMFNRQLPHGYKLGTKLEAHVHVGTNTIKTGTVNFALEYTIVDIHGTFSVTQTINGTLTITEDSQYKHLYLDLGDIVGSGLEGVSAMILGRIYRDTSEDNFDDDFFLFELDFHYQIDAPGSLEETKK